MDLSGLKWPLIIAVLAATGWLLSSGGVNYMEKKFTSGTPGADAARDAANEAGLSKLGGYCLMLFRYGKARDIYREALGLYPDGKNNLWNQYQLARCHERLENYQTTVELLQGLVGINASAIDKRVPQDDELRLRIEKLVELHELGRR